MAKENCKIIIIAILLAVFAFYANDCLAGAGMNTWNDMDDSFPSRAGKNLTGFLFLAVIFYHAPFWTSVFLSAISGATILYNGGTGASIPMFIIFGLIAVYLKFSQRPTKPDPSP